MSVTKPTQTSSDSGPESKRDGGPGGYGPESGRDAARGHVGEGEAQAEARTEARSDDQKDSKASGARTVFDLAQEIDPKKIGTEICGLITELYPICRSITGNGFRETMTRIARRIPLKVEEVPTGTKVFDWTVPREWNIRDAYIKNSKGERIVDFRKCNLHVVNYSVPVAKKMMLEELKERIYTLPNHAQWIPYRTSYYAETWGFCMAHEELEKLEKQDKKDAKEGNADPLYEVCIDSTLENGSLTYGEYYLEGESTDEVLISVHACHPSLCNDNLSGVGVATFLAKLLSEAPRKLSYRFLFIPGTIGSITWLSRNEDKVEGVKAGLVLACVGDKGGMSYKRSRQGDAEIDRVVVNLLKCDAAAQQDKKQSGKDQTANAQNANAQNAKQTKEPLIRDFSPYGYDERQYCSPGFNLPVGCLSRTPHGEFPEYHSSGDNLKFVDAKSLGDSLQKCLQIFGALEENATFVNQNPKGEPQLGKRGLYRTMGGYANAAEREMAMLWVLNFSDGSHTLLDIAERAEMPFEVLRLAARDLEKHGLLVKAEEQQALEEGGIDGEGGEGNPA